VACGAHFHRARSPPRNTSVRRLLGPTTQCPPDHAALRLARTNGATSQLQSATPASRQTATVFQQSSKSTGSDRVSTGARRLQRRLPLVRRRPSARGAEPPSGRGDVFRQVLLAVRLLQSVAARTGRMDAGVDLLVLLRDVQLGLVIASAAAEAEVRRALLHRRRLRPNRHAERVGARARRGCPPLDEIVLEALARAEDPRGRGLLLGDLLLVERALKRVDSRPRGSQAVPGFVVLLGDKNVGHVVPF